MRLVMVVALAAAACVARAQSVAVLNIALYTAGANIQESTDSVESVVATEKLRDTLAHFPGLRLVDSASTAAATSAPAAVSAANGKPCNVIVACARAVGKVLGVPWVVMGKVSKTSNLIWVLSGELINVETGALVLDDDFELKGDPRTMVPAGVGLFATRVAKRARAAPHA
jgi:TolB-like protein